MKMTLIITQNVGGIEVQSYVSDHGSADVEQTNLWAIGALEVAKASLLARRWGLNIGNQSSRPLIADQPLEVGRKPAVPKKGKRSAKRRIPATK